MSAKSYSQFLEYQMSSYGPYCPLGTLSSSNIAPKRWIPSTHSGWLKTSTTPVVKCLSVYKREQDWETTKSNQNLSPITLVFREQKTVTIKRMEPTVRLCPLNGVLKPEITQQPHSVQIFLFELSIEVEHTREKRMCIQWIFIRWINLWNHYSDHDLE